MNSGWMCWWGCVWLFPGTSVQAGMPKLIGGRVRDIETTVSIKPWRGLTEWRWCPRGSSCAIAIVWHQGAALRQLCDSCNVLAVLQVCGVRRSGPVPICLLTSCFTLTYNSCPAVASHAAHIPGGFAVSHLHTCHCSAVSMLRPSSHNKDMWQHVPAQLTA